jgi:exoribonuclease-2
MLNLDTLNQLQSLKQDIHESIPRYQGVVREGNGKYGFVNTPDRKQFFLPPHEMEKVLPGDVIDFKVVETDKKKKQAVIESLVSTSIKKFSGQYVIKGKGHFVVPQHPSLKRWMFIPPKDRLKAKEGQLVSCEVSGHPYPSKRSQAKIIHIIGNLTDANIESSFMPKAWLINDSFSPQEIELADQYTNASSILIEQQLTTRKNLTTHAFVTIDSPNSLDLDDALYCQKTDTGWTLTVAIADPTLLIKEDDYIDVAALKRATSCYLPGKTLPMLPPSLSNNALSLLPKVIRPTISCEMTINHEGVVSDYVFHESVIKSQGKLSYQKVHDFLSDSNTSELSDEIQTNLLNLDGCSQALLNNRKNTHLVIPNKPEYKLILDEQGKISEIKKNSHNSAHRLVEECMVSTNYCAAQFMSKNESGLYIQHNGIRTERLGDIKNLVQEYANVFNLLDTIKPNDFNTFRSIQHTAQNANETLNLSAIIARQLERSHFTTEVKPHNGMSFSCYTHFTSPLRRYNDLLVHRIIKKQLNKQQTTPISNDILDHIQNTQLSARLCAQKTEFWLKEQWLQNQEKDIIYAATIKQINSNGMSVQLDDNGLEGAIDIRKIQGKWTLDRVHYCFKNEEDSVLSLEQSIKVKIKSIHSLEKPPTFELIM